MELPKFGVRLDHLKCGLAWDGRNGAYKVFASYLYQTIRAGYVYSSKTNSWKPVEQGCQFLCSRSGLFARGKIHWVTQCGYIESFDLESEEFGRIELPFYPKGYICYLEEIGGCLHLLCDHNSREKSTVDVWVMKEYVVKESWLKLVTIPLVYPKEKIIDPMLFGGGPNGDIWLIYGANFSVYYPKDNALRAAKNIIKFDDGRVYVESLVSPC